MHRNTGFTYFFIKIMMSSCLVLTTGCWDERGEVGPTFPQALPKEEDVVTKPNDKVTDLSHRLREQSDDEIQQLSDVLKIHTKDSLRNLKLLKEPLSTIADELLCLTLEEADRLGSMLEGQENAKRLPVLIADRQVQARAVVEEYQKRLKKGLDEYQIKSAISVEPLKLSWLEAETSRKFEQVTALNLEREEYDDLGPIETDLSDNELIYVGMLTGLKHLSIQESQVTAKGFHELRYLKHLESLDARRVKVASGDWSSLRKLTGLRELSLQPMKENKVDIAWVGQLPNLEELLVYEANMTQTELTGLCQSQSLRTLELHGEIRKQTILLHDLPQLTNLRLSIHANAENSSAFLKLANLKQLQDFNLGVYPHRNDPKRVTLEQLDLIKLPKLKRVSLTVLQFSTKGLSSLGKLPSLQGLWMHGTTIPGEAFRSLEELDELTDLICQTDDGNRALQSISHIKSLNKLILIAEDISDEGLKAVSGLPQLTSLHLSQIKASKVFSKEIMKLNNLRELRVDGGVLPIINLVDHPALKNIRFNQVQSEEIELKGLPKLRHLDFEEGEFSKIKLNQLPKLDTCLLATVRPENVRSIELLEVPRLHTFSLSSHRRANKAPRIPFSLGDDFIAQFHPLQRLHRLSLSNVLVTDQGLLKLGHLLHLGQRDINGPYVTDEGHTKLKRAIEAHRIKTWGNKSP